MDDGLAPHALAVAFEMARLGRVRPPPDRPGETDGSDRFLGRTARRACDAAHGDRHLRVAAVDRALGHFAYDLFGYGAMLLERVAADAEHLPLRYVGVGDEAALEPGGAARHHGHRLGDPAAGARLGGGEHEITRLERVPDTLGEAVEDCVGHLREDLLRRDD